MPVYNTISSCFTRSPGVAVDVVYLDRGGVHSPRHDHPGPADEAAARREPLRRHRRPLSPSPGGDPVPEHPVHASGRRGGLNASEGHQGVSVNEDLGRRLKKP